VKRAVLITLALVIIAIVLSLGWLLTSESGLRWVYRQAQPVLPGELHLQQLSGSLGGGIALRGIEYDNGDIKVSADRLLLQWNPWALLAARLQISSIDIGRLELQLPPAPGEPRVAGGDITLPSLRIPLQVTLQRLGIEEIFLRRGDASYHLQQIELQAESRDRVVRIDRFAVHLADMAVAGVYKSDFDISLAGTIEPGADYRHDLRIDWSTRLSNAAVVDNVALLQGDINATRLTHRSSGPLQAELTLDLQQPLRKPAWQASLQVSDLDSSRLDSRLPVFKGNIELSAKGDLQSARIDGHIDADSADLGKLDTRFELASLENARLFDGLRIESLKLAFLDGEFAAQGQLFWAPALSWNGEVSASHVNPAGLLPEWPGDLNARLYSEGGFENDRLIASATIVESSGTLRNYPVSLTGKLRWQDGNLDVQAADLRSGTTHVLANGRIGDALDLHWSVDTRDFAQLYPGAEGQLAASGHLGGRLDAPFVEAGFHGKSIRLPDYAVAAVDGDIAIDLFDWQRLRVSLSAQHLELQGQQLQSVEVSADNKRIDARLVGARVSAEFSLAGELRDKSWRGRLLAANIQTADFTDWRLQQPVALTLSADAIVSERLCLLSSDRAEFCGTLQRRANDWDIDLELAGIPLRLLQQWAPPALIMDGRVDASAALQYAPGGALLGKMDASLPRGSVSYPLQEGKPERFDYRLGKLSLLLEPAGIKSTVTLTLQNGDHVQGSLEMPGASILDLDTRRQALQASASARLRNWAIVDGMIPQVENLRGELELNLTVSGVLSKPSLQGSARLRDGGVFLPALKMEADQIEVNASSEGSERIEFDATARLASGSVSLRGNTILNPEQNWPSNLSINAEGLQISSLLAQWIEPPLTVAGQLAVKAQLTFHAPDSLFGTIDISSPRGSFDYPLVAGEKQNWDYRDGFISATLNEQGINAGSGILVGPNSALKSELTLPGARLLSLDIEHQPLRASAHVDFDELSLIELIVPDVDRVQGKLLLDLSASGSLAKPVLGARAGITQASLRIPRLGLQIRQIELQGSSDDLHAFNFKLSARSGDGELAIDGSTRLDPAQGWPTRFSVKGNDFEVSRIPEALVTVTPDLQVTLENRSIDISGDLKLPFARLRPKDVSSAVRVSNDTVVIGSQKPPDEKWLVTTRVNLSLGDRVTFYGFGFEGDLGGRLLIEDEPGQLSTGTGEITIKKGRYRAYGQRLDINNGRLLFTGGALDNPGLDMRAIRQTEDVTVGLQVRGRLQQPELELFSIPTMDQTDMLSYLLFGHPMETASGSEGETMAKAALALGLAGGDSMARQLVDRFGLDEMRVETNDTGDQASLVVGRYLSPKLYVSYGVGLVESINKINLRYQLSNRWKLEAESGEYQGADLLFTIER
jgi:translocation and assembly module TamB